MKSLPTIGVNDLASQNPVVASQAHGWDPGGVCLQSSKKKDWICSLGHIWTAAVSKRVAGRGCPYCANRKVLTGFNDLLTRAPMVAAEADGWDPSLVLSGSNSRMPWVCSERHTWHKRVCDRVIGIGCPYCANKMVWPGSNDLTTTNPDIAAQAYQWDPSTVTYGSKKIFEWIGPCGHIWRTSPNARTNNFHSQGCPYCSVPARKILAGCNDLATTHPEIAAEAYGWDPTKVVRGNLKQLMWKSTACGHMWKSSPNTRTSKRTVCPYCINRRLLRGFNDVSTVYPDIAAQANGWNPRDTIASISSCGIARNWICSAGHRWKEPLARMVSNMGRCPECYERSGGFSVKSSGYLYMMCQPDWGLTQIGISNSKIDRVQQHRNSGWSLLNIVGPLPGNKILSTESSLKRWLRSEGIPMGRKPDGSKFDGYTESWPEEELLVSSIYELCQLAGV